MRGPLLLALFGVFAPLSFTTIGGGQSVVSEIHRQVVTEFGWLDEQGFVTLFALSRLTPGPGSLLVTLIGWSVAGWMGAVVASVAIFVPSSVLLYGLARVWARHRGARWQRAMEVGLQPIAAGLILAAGLTVLQAAPGGVVAWGVAAASTAVLALTRVSPFLLLGAGRGCSCCWVWVDPRAAGMALLMVGNAGRTAVLEDDAAGPDDGRAVGVVVRRVWAVLPA